MELKTKARKSFYANEFDLDRMNEILDIAIEHLTLREILKLVRHVSYDMTCYYGDDLKGVIYNGEYSQLHIEQATTLQREIRTMCDLFNQSVVGKREFDQKHFETYIAMYATSRANGLEKENERLRQTIIDLEEQLI